MCDPDKRECQITTRVSVMLPKVPGLGVWRLDTKGWNAAATLPTTLETLGAIAPGQWIPAVLRIQKQSSKKIVNGRSQTRRFVVPVIDIVAGTIGEALDGALSAVPAPRLDAGPSRREKVSRPALGPAAPLPERAQLHAGDRPERVTRPTTSAPAAGAAGATEWAPAAQPVPAAESAAAGPSTGAADDADVVEGEAVEVTAGPVQCPSTSDPAMGEVEQCRREQGHKGAHRTENQAWPQCSPSTW
jgi:hypothetical protein